MSKVTSRVSLSVIKGLRFSVSSQQSKSKANKHKEFYCFEIEIQSNRASEIPHNVTYYHELFSMEAKNMNFPLTTKWRSINYLFFLAVVVVTCLWRRRVQDTPWGKGLHVAEE